MAERKTESKTLRLPVSLVLPVFVVVLAVLPVFWAVLPVLLVSGVWTKALLIAAAPLIWAALYLVTSIALAFPFRRSIVRGKFPRDLRHEVYGRRRLYGMGWGAVFYCTPLYFVVVSLPRVRAWVFRAFGYRGSMSASVAPDAWIRDLPLLGLGEGAYVANKSTLGTNMCLANNSILVDRITLGERAMVGHLAMVAPGVRMGSHSELGVGAGLGIRAQVGARCRIGPTSTVNHGAVLGDDVEVGTLTYVGVKAHIGSGLRIPSGVSIPDGASILTRDDLERVLRSESARVDEHVGRLKAKFPAPGPLTEEALAPASVRKLGGA